MKKLILMFWLIAFFAIAQQSANACKCGHTIMELVKNENLKDNSPKPSPEEVKKWARKQTDFAIFIGHVVKIKKVKIKQSGESVSMKKVTVSVERYWAGVKTQEIIIYTPATAGMCGIHYEIGKQYFVWATRSNDLLETDICSPTKLDDKLKDDLNRMFGEAEEFL